MNSHRGNTANPTAVRRTARGRKRPGHRAQVAAFVAWQRSRGAQQAMMSAQRPPAAARV
jgi:hypothetical protein